MIFWQICEGERLIEVVYGEEKDIKEYIKLEYPGTNICPLVLKVVNSQYVKKLKNEQDKIRRRLFGEHCC